MKTQTKLAIGMVIAIVAVFIVSRSITHDTEVQKIKQGQNKLKQSENGDKAKLKAKQEATRDLSSGSENIR